jgi:hypothetical protein
MVGCCVGVEGLGVRLPVAESLTIKARFGKKEIKKPRCCGVFYVFVYGRLVPLI